MAEILINLLLESGRPLQEFILHADWRDGGQDAALTFLDRDLGELTAEFLGPGNWRPKRKVISEICRPGS